MCNHKETGVKHGADSHPYKKEVATAHTKLNDTPVLMSERSLRRNLTFTVMSMEQTDPTTKIRHHVAVKLMDENSVVEALQQQKNNA